jgi:hypothetical protein
MFKGVKNAGKLENVRIKTKFYKKNCLKNSVCVKLATRGHFAIVQKMSKMGNFVKGNESPKDRMIDLRLSTVLRLSQKMLTF